MDVKIDEKSTKLNVEFRESETNLNVSSVKATNTVVVVKADHTLLENRDTQDSHPMNAITGLKEAIAEKISQSDLQSGIDTALAQAKASGEFDGAPGTDGKTPIKGMDYWTSDDKEEIVADTKEAIDLADYAKKTELDSYLPLTGGTCTGGITAPNFQTGSNNAAYFQTKKMRGQGDANEYRHAVDWGYSGHDKVDFYEYGGTWNFYQCQSVAASAAKLVGSIKYTGWNGGAVLTGTPTAPTAAEGTNTTQIATTEFVQAAIQKALKDAGLIE